MKQYLLFVIILFSFSLNAQNLLQDQKITATIINSNTFLPVSNVNVVNINKIKGSVSNAYGLFEIEATINDTLHVSCIGYQSLKVRVTNDWVKNKSTKIQITTKAYALEEVVVRPFNLTGYLEIDSRLIPLRENYRYSISGLSTGYEGGNYSPGAFGKVLGSIFNPADLLYNFFGNKPKELRKLREMKKDDSVRNLLASRFDRETLAVLLNVDKKDIAEILERCNYSEEFVKNANDLQVMEAMSECYEEYKILKKK